MLLARLHWVGVKSDNQNSGYALCGDSQHKPCSCTKKKKVKMKLRLKSWWER